MTTRGFAPISAKAVIAIVMSVALVALVAHEGTRVGRRSFSLREADGDGDDGEGVATIDSGDTSANLGMAEDDEGDDVEDDEEDGASSSNGVEETRSVQTGNSAARKRLADGCRWVYLDLGGNIGVQVRKLFEPEKYPGAAFVQYVKSNITSNVEDLRKYACAFSVEANKVHVKRLKALERCYRDVNGWKTHIFVPRAVGAVDDEELKLYDNAAPKNEFWGASTVNVAPKAGKPTIVKTIDIARFINEEVVGRKLAMTKEDEIVQADLPPPRIFAKMDIEGSEYETLISMLLKGTLCEVNDIFLESHPSYYDLAAKMTAKSKKTTASQEEVVETLETIQFVLRSRFAAKACRDKTVAKLVQVDDELYRHDGMPFPSNCQMRSGSPKHTSGR